MHRHPKVRKQPECRDSREPCRRGRWLDPDHYSSTSGTRTLDEAALHVRPPRPRPRTPGVTAATSVSPGPRPPQHTPQTSQLTRSANAKALQAEHTGPGESRQRPRQAACVAGTPAVHDQVPRVPWGSPMPQKGGQTHDSTEVASYTPGTRQRPVCTQQAPAAERDLDGRRLVRPPPRPLAASPAPSGPRRLTRAATDCTVLRVPRSAAG